MRLVIQRNLPHKKTELTDDLLEFDEVTIKTLEHFEQIADKGTRGTKRLRSKKKWKIAKAWRHLKPTVFYNLDKLAFTKTLFIHHQLHKALVQGPHFQCRRSLISLKDLDHRKGLTYAELHSRDRQSHKHGKQRCVRQETQHTLNEYNADSGLPTDLIGILITAQHRDLTPEDYVLLLWLDDRVKHKTTKKAALLDYRSERVTFNDTATSETCIICLEPYSIG